MEGSLACREVTVKGEFVIGSVSTFLQLVVASRLFKAIYECKAW